MRISANRAGFAAPRIALGPLIGGYPRPPGGLARAVGGEDGGAATGRGEHRTACAARQDDPGQGRPVRAVDNAQAAGVGRWSDRGRGRLLRP
jgi:hypothetical protein